MLKLLVGRVDLSNRPSTRGFTYLSGATPHDHRRALHQVGKRSLDDLAASGPIESWWESIYEPETHAFGGPTGMDIAHELFHHDTHALLTCRHLLHRPGGVGRRELTVLLCGALLRAARLDRAEQGDVWHRVTQIRALPDHPATGARVRSLAPKIAALLTADTSDRSTLLHTGGPLDFAATWTTAVTTAGSELADAARDGHLRRGIRDVLSNHIIFHWNRTGIPAAEQATMAHAAREALLPDKD